MTHCNQVHSKLHLISLTCTADDGLSFLTLVHVCEQENEHLVGCRLAGVYSTQIRWIRRNEYEQMLWAYVQHRSSEKLIMVRAVNEKARGCKKPFSFDCHRQHWTVETLDARARCCEEKFQRLERIVLSKSLPKPISGEWTTANGFKN